MPETAEATATVEAPSADDMADLIAGAGDDGVAIADTETATDEAVAPTEDNAAEKQPSEDGQPTDDAEKKGEAGEEDAEKAKAESEDSEKKEGEEDTEKAADETEAEMNRRDALGLSQIEPETPERLKEKLSESSREAHRVVEERKAMLAAMAEQLGLEAVRKADGNWGFTRAEGFEDNLDLAKEGVEVSGIFSSLTEQEKDLIDTNERAYTDLIAEKAAKQAVAAINEKRPKATAEKIDSVLSQEDMDTVFQNMSEMKLRDGRQRFPDLMEEDVLSVMRELWDDPNPVTRDFVLLANRSKDHFRHLVGLYHSRTASVLAPERAAAKDAEAQAKLKAEKAKKDASTTTADGVSSGGLGGQTPEDVLADQIASTEEYE